MHSLSTSPFTIIPDHSFVDLDSNDLKKTEEIGEPKENVPTLDPATVLIKKLPGGLPTETTVQRIRSIFADSKIKRKNEQSDQIKHRKCISNHKQYTYDVAKEGILGHTGHVIGRGKSKIAKMLVRVDSDEHEFYARVTFFKTVFDTETDNEIEMHELFKADKEFAQLLYYYEYTGKLFGRRELKKVAMVMPYYNFMDLEHYLNNLNDTTDIKEREILINDLVPILDNILVGLVKMQGKKVIHRDIKPANIFLHRDSSKDPIQSVIGDFGLAKFINMEDNTPKGSPLYMAPEYLILHYSSKDKLDKKLKSINAHLNNPFIKKSHDTNRKLTIRKDRIINLFEIFDKKTMLCSNPKIDLWALGLIIYEALYGKRFYEELNNGKSHKDSVYVLTKHILMTTQNEVDELLNTKKMNSPAQSPNEKKLESILQEIMIWDQEQRPEAEDILALFRQ